MQQAAGAFHLVTAWPTRLRSVVTSQEDVPLDLHPERDDSLSLLAARPCPETILEELHDESARNAHVQEGGEGPFESRKGRDLLAGWNGRSQTIPPPVCCSGRSLGCWLEAGGVCCQASVPPEPAL